MSRKETITAVILLVLLGASMHFVHYLPFFNHFLGYFFPVVESVMAHMKMVFYPMTLLSVYLILSRRDIREFGAPLLAGLAVMPIIVAVFFSYWVFVRHELLALDIIIYVVALAGAVLLAGRWRKKESIRKRWPLWMLLFLLGTVIIGYLTYHSPDWIIFADLG